MLFAKQKQKVQLSECSTGQWLMHTGYSRMLHADLPSWSLYWLAGRRKLVDVTTIRARLSMSNAPVRRIRAAGSYICSSQRRGDMHTQHRGLPGWSDLVAWEYASFSSFFLFFFFFFCESCDAQHHSTVMSNRLSRQQDQEAEGDIT